jgi:hypothetical protein
VNKIESKRTGHVWLRIFIIAYSTGFLDVDSTPCKVNIILFKFGEFLNLSSGQTRCHRNEESARPAAELTGKRTWCSVTLVRNGCTMSASESTTQSGTTRGSVFRVEGIRILSSPEAQLSRRCRKASRPNPPSSN